MAQDLWIRRFSLRTSTYMFISWANVLQNCKGLCLRKKQDKFSSHVQVDQTQPMLQDFFFYPSLHMRKLWRFSHPQWPQLEPIHRSVIMTMPSRGKGATWATLRIQCVHQHYDDGKRRICICGIWLKLAFEPNAIRSLRSGEVHLTMMLWTLDTFRSWSTTDIPQDKFMTKLEG